jgi:hypothetical protein
MWVVLTTQSREVVRMGDDMNKTVGNQVLLTSDDIQRWQMELRAAEEAKAKAEAVIADRRKRLDAAALLSGFSFSFEETADSEQETLAAGVKRILGALGKPVAHYELQAELRKVPRFAAMLDKNKGAYYYTLIKRLADADSPEIKKVGKKIRFVHKEDSVPRAGDPDAA